MPWKLLWRNLAGHPLRSALTLGAVAVAVFLVCVLQAVTSGLTRTLNAASASRLLVQSAVSLFVDLPLSYQQKIAAVPGIEAICKWQYFGGRYEQDKGGYFAQFGIDAETFLVSYPEMSITAGSYEQFTKTRTACLIGTDLVDKYGWQVGQTVPITGTIFQRTDGKPWEFTVAGIAHQAPDVGFVPGWRRAHGLRRLAGARAGAAAERLAGDQCAGNRPPGGG